MDSFLWLIGEAIFHMLPVCICWSVTKKMGTTQSLGIVLGLTLVSGQLLNAYSVATANSVGVGGLPGILSIQPASMLSFALCMAIAMVVPFVLTVAMGKKKGVQ